MKTPQEFRQSEDAEVVCDVISSPVPAVSWFYKTREITSEPNSKSAHNSIRCSRVSELEPCKPVGTRHAESIRAGFRAVFVFDRSGSDQTRAHLASRLLLCPNTCTPHMYCMKYCYNNYIINIIHHLCDKQVRNAYTHALAYR